MPAKMSSTRLATSSLNCTTADENTKSCFDLAVTTAQCTLAQSFSKGCECVLNCISSTLSTSSLSSQTCSQASVLKLTKAKQRSDQSLPAFGSLFGPTAFLLAFCLLLLQTPVADCVPLATNTLKSDVPASGNDHSLSTETFSHQHLKSSISLQASIAFSQNLCGSSSQTTFSDCLRTLIRTVRQLEAGGQHQQQQLTDQRYARFLDVAGSKHLEILLRRNAGQGADEEKSRVKRSKRSTFLLPGYGTHRTRKLIGKKHLFLEIRGKGVGGSKNASSEYVVLDIMSTGLSAKGISIKGRKANKYLCFNKRGKITTKKRFKPNSCSFRQIINDDNFSHYIYEGKKSSGSKCKGCYWFLSMSRRGVVRKREALHFTEATTMWSERKIGNAGHSGHSDS